MRNLRILIGLLRVKHWIKNAFVFAPLIFSLNFTDFQNIVEVLIAFLSFSLVSSFVYIINDIHDRERDKMHPNKKNRPIASGKISVPKAFLVAFVCLSLSMIIALQINFAFIIVIVAYSTMNLLYTFRLKSIVILDVMIIALGFVLRIIAGAIAINVPISSWIILTTLNLSLFMGFGKRRHELIFTNEAYNHKIVLKEYSVKFLDYMIIVSVSLTIMSYALYTMDERTILRFGTDKLIYTVPFVLYGLFRYMYLIYRRDEGGDPAEIVSKDIGIIFSVFLWLLSFMLLVIFKEVI